MERSLKISILMENQASMSSLGKTFLAQHGLSVFVDASKRVLFDTGPTSIFMHNAKLLGVDLEMTDVVTLSHGHWDHSDGLKSFQPMGPRSHLLSGRDTESKRLRGKGDQVFLSGWSKKKAGFHHG
jgi:7,8-dihydropterin-6-yl-methyl-4-(beta-D-ribofuranosyl)aminobenzene 5'-phosphate synthase